MYFHIILISTGLYPFILFITNCDCPKYCKIQKVGAWSYFYQRHFLKNQTYFSKVFSYWIETSSFQRVSHFIFMCTMIQTYYKVCLLLSALIYGCAYFWVRLLLSAFTFECTYFWVRLLLSSLTFEWAYFWVSLLLSALTFEWAYFLVSILLSELTF